jgi:hypothetical protein
VAYKIQQYKKYFSLGIILTLLINQNFNSQTNNLPKNSLKVSVAPIFVGEVNFNYERFLFKKISSEIGIGFVTDNYLMNFLSESNANDVNKVKIGPSVGGMLKYYPFVLGDELYLDLEFKYRRYRKSYSQDFGALFFNEFNERYISRIGVGYHYFLDDYIFFDFSGNLGLIFQNSLQFSNQEIKSSIKLNFGLGLKFGYLF